MCVYFDPALMASADSHHDKTYAKTNFNVCRIIKCMVCHTSQVIQSPWKPLNITIAIQQKKGKLPLKAVL